MLHGLAIWFGLTNGSGHAYLFWSGLGSDVSEVMLFAGLAGLYRKHSCHVQGCWRIGRHEVPKPDGTKHVVCRRHHPPGVPTHKDILWDHAQASGLVPSDRTRPPE